MSGPAIARRAQSGLHAGDTVDGELVLAPEVAHLRGEVGVKDITGRGIGLAAVQVLQALSQPAHPERRASRPTALSHR